MGEFISQYFVPSLMNIVPFPRRFSWKPQIFYTKGPGAKKNMNTMSGFADALNSIFKTSMGDHMLEYCKIVRLSSQFNNLKIIFEGLNINSDPIHLGKLAFKQEPGKIRVFAMVDCVTQ